MFTKKANEICAQYPKLEQFVQSEVSNLQKRWQDLLQDARNFRVTIDSSVSYFKMLDEVRSPIYFRTCVDFSLFIINLIFLRSCFPGPVSDQTSVSWS